MASLGLGLSQGLCPGMGPQMPYRAPVKTSCILASLVAEVGAYERQSNEIEKRFYCGKSLYAHDSVPS